MVNTSANISEKLYASRDIYFCPNGNTAVEIGRKNLSAEKKMKIRELHKLDKRWNLVVPLHVALWLLSCWLAVASNILVVNILCFVVAGLSLSTLSVLAHESTHNLFTHNPNIDQWIGFLCSLPLFFSPTGYRTIHPLHHKHARTPDDPDDVENTTRNSHFLAVVYIVILFLGVYVYLFVVQIKGYLYASKHDRLRIIMETLLMLAIHISAWLYFESSIMIQAWLIPLLIAGQIGNLRGLAEHGFTSGGNEFTDTRTVLVNPVLSFSMCNINYHLEHHLYPGVPWYNLPKLHRLLQEDYRKAGSSVYTSYGSFLSDVFKALKAGVVPGQRLIPVHLREEICL